MGFLASDHVVTMLNRSANPAARSEALQNFMARGDDGVCRVSVLLYIADAYLERDKVDSFAARVLLKLAIMLRDMKMCPRDARDTVFVPAYQLGAVFARLAISIEELEDKAGVVANALRLCAVALPTAIIRPPIELGRDNPEEATVRNHWEFAQDFFGPKVPRIIAEGAAELIISVCNIIPINGTRFMRKWPSLFGVMSGWTSDNKAFCASLRDEDEGVSQVTRAWEAVKGKVTIIA